VQNNRSATQDEEISRVLENGRFVMRHLGRELAMAGFWGKYLDIDLATNHLLALVGQDCGDTIVDWVKAYDAIEFINNATVAQVAANHECLPSARIEVGSDVIALKRTADAETADADIVLGQMYMRSNGANAQFFLGGTFGTPPALGGTETNWAYFPYVYYVRDYSVNVGDGIPTLCRAYLSVNILPNMTNECLVEGIENIQIEFGVDTDSDFVANYYQATPTAAEVTNAVSARLYVMARSVNTVPGYTNDKTYTMGSTTVPAANDGFYRRVFSSTILLRNPANLVGIGS